LWSAKALAEVRIATAHAVRLLGGVDQQKEKGEGARGNRALLYGEIVHLRQKIGQGRRAGLTVPARTGRDAQALDNLERLLPFQALDDASKSGSEPTDILVERKIFRTTGTRPSRLKSVALAGIVGGHA
jgi:hypothetical protein